MGAGRRALLESLGKRQEQTKNMRPSLATTEGCIPCKQQKAKKAYEGSIKVSIKNR